MIATILPKFKEEWEDLQFEATKYLAAIFKFWLRKSMFPEGKPNIHNIVVKFRCSHTQPQKYLHGYQKPPKAEQTTVQPESVSRRKRKVRLFKEVDEVDTDNVVPKKKLKVRKAKLQK